MSAQDALAAILSLEGGHALLRADPLLLQRQYDLSDDELAMLTGASPAGYRLTRDSVRAKLRRAMAAWLPRTVAVLAERHPGLWQEFVHCTVRRPRPGEEAAGPGEAEELVALLASRVPGPLADYARYELARTMLSRDRRAARAAHEAQTVQTNTAAQAARASGGVLRVSEAVRIVEFGYDVMARAPITDLPAARTRLLLRRRWHAPPAVYRINDRTAALLASCDGTRDAGGVIAAAGGDPVKAASVLDALLACGAVQLQRDP